MTHRSFFRGFVKAAANKRVSTVAVIHKGKIILGKRRDNKKWTPPGGHLNPGETPLAGAHRETLEEIGMKMDPARLKAIGNEVVTKPDGTTIHVYAFRYDCAGDEDIDITHDPDKEFTELARVGIGQGLPKPFVDELHVPMKDNVLFKALGLTASKRVAHLDLAHDDSAYRKMLAKARGQEKTAAYLSHADIAYYDKLAKARAAGGRTSDVFHEELKRRFGQTKAAEEDGALLEGPAYSQWFIEKLKRAIGQT